MHEYIGFHRILMQTRFYLDDLKQSQFETPFNILEYLWTKWNVSGMWSWVFANYAIRS